MKKHVGECPFSQHLVRIDPDRQTVRLDVRRSTQDEYQNRHMSDLPWTGSVATVSWSESRYDTDTGRYFGAARFEPMARPHRLGPAVGYMLEGALSDHDNDAEGVCQFDRCCPRCDLPRRAGGGASTGQSFIPMMKVFLPLREAADEGESVDATVEAQPTSTSR